MGLAFEIIFLFIAINYLGIQFLGDKMADSEYKSKRADEEYDLACAEKRREYAKNVEGVVCSRYDYNGSVSKKERDSERECVEVFKTLPLWNDIKSWNTWKDSRCNYLKGKAKEKEESRKQKYMDSVADIIYFANRGKIPSNVLSIERDLFYGCSFEKEQELMLWWRNKMRSMGIVHELWFCYERKIELKGEKRTVCLTKQCKCPIEYASPSLRGRYCWDMEYDAVHSRFTEQPTDSGRPYEIRECPSHWFTTAAISTDYVMRLPTPNEWALLCNSYDLLNDEQKFDVRNSSILANHAEGMLCVKDTLYNRVLPGYISWNWRWCEKYSDIKKSTAFSESAIRGFRPAFELTTDDIYERMSYEIGKSYVIGTLYMEGKPARITTGDAPIEVSCNKRGVKLYEDPPIEHYEFTSILELGEPREDPQYQIMGIYIGDGVFISRDILLDKMSYSDVVWSINKAKELRALAENNG